MKYATPLLVLLTGICSSAFAQNPPSIGVETPSNLEALEGLPTEEISERFQDMSAGRDLRGFQNQQNNISSDELDSRALQKIFRSLRFPNRPPLLTELQNESQLLIYEILSDARTYRLREEQASYEALCAQWNNPNSAILQISERSSQSLDAYKANRESSTPSINDRYQSALNEIENSISSSEWQVFLKVFSNVRESYLDTVIVEWDDFVRSSENGPSMIARTCNR